MSKNIINIGMDVHKESIDVALAPEGSTEVRHYGTIGGELGSVDHVAHKLMSDGSEIRIAYDLIPVGLFPWSHDWLYGQ